MDHIYVCETDPIKTTRLRLADLIPHPQYSYNIVSEHELKRFVEIIHGIIIMNKVYPLRSTLTLSFEILYTHAVSG